MKKYFLLLLITSLEMAAASLEMAARACPACEKTQPRLLRGIAHGPGPESRWDYIIVWIAIIVAVLTLLYSVKWLICPGEAKTTHIKHFILNNDQYER